VDALAEILGRLQNPHIILTHVSRRTGIRKARAILRRKLGVERMANIQFLMDIEGAAEGGDVEQAGPNPQPDSPD
jgi:hypothetical protein